MPTARTLLAEVLSDESRRTPADARLCRNTARWCACAHKAQTEVREVGWSGTEVLVQALLEVCDAFLGGGGLGLLVGLDRFFGERLLLAAALLLGPQLVGL